MAGEKISTKIGVKQIMGDMGNILVNLLIPAGAGKSVPLYRIAGAADRVRIAKGKDDKPAIAIVGEFSTINLLTGEVGNGTQAFFPGDIGDMIYAAMKTGDDKFKSVEFAFEISAAYQPDAITKYVYSVHSLLAIEKSDKMKGLLARLPDFTAGVKQLAAPSPAPTPEPAPAPDKKPEPPKKK